VSQAVQTHLLISTSMVDFDFGAWKQFSAELSSVDGELLRYPERAFNFPHSGFVLIDQSTDSVGTVIWDAEVFLSHYLDSFADLSTKLFLEIGAGTALASIVAAKRGAQVFIQELDEILPQCQVRMEQNQVSAEYVGGLWGEELSRRILFLAQDQFDLIVASDVLYHPEHFTDLNKTILTCSKVGTELIVVYELRRRDLGSYFTTLSEHFETIAVLCYEAVRQGDESESETSAVVTKFFLYHLKRIK
jgi:protein N-lysine methyltransferase METTL21A